MEWIKLITTASSLLYDVVLAFDNIVKGDSYSDPKDALKRIQREIDKLSDLTSKLQAKEADEQARLDAAVPRTE